MVNPLLSLTRSGVKDHLLQRLSAVFLGIYALVGGGMVAWQGAYTHFGLWRDFFAYPLMKASTCLAVACVVIHAWIGLWTVITDYIKPPRLRLGAQLMLAMICIGEWGWSVAILWGL